MDKWLSFIQVAVVPLVGTIAALLRGRFNRHDLDSVEKFLTLRSQIPANDFHSLDMIDNLISSNLDVFSYHYRRRLGRKVEYASIFMVVFLLALSTLATYYSFHFSTWWSYLILGSIALILLLIVLIGSTTIYVFPNIEKPDLLKDKKP